MANLDQIMDYLADYLEVKTGTITPASGSSVNEVQVKQVGRLVMLKGYFSKNSGNYSTGSNFNIGTFNGVDFPASNLRTVCGAGEYAYSATDSGYMILGPNGQITCQLATARRNITFCVVYIAAS